MASVDLSVNLAGVHFNNPVAMASGNAGYGLEYKRLWGFSYADAGAVFLKGTTLEPRVGNRPERVQETALGLLNSVGLQNPGVDKVINDYFPQLDFSQTQFIPNVSGNTLEEYAEVTARFDQTPVSAIEINISCPNVKAGGAAFGNDPVMAAKVVAACRKATSKPLIVKLSPNQTDIAQGAQAVIDEGADILSAINTLVGMNIDINSRKPGLGNNQGGLSGAAIKPIALLKVWQVYQVAKKHHIPIIGLGGIQSWQDAVEFFLAGANMVAVGTALAKDPLVIKKINKGLKKYLQRQGYDSIAPLVGQLQLNDDPKVCALN